MLRWPCHAWLIPLLLLLAAAPARAACRFGELQCAGVVIVDVNGTPVAGGGGSSPVPTGTAGTPSASVVTVQGIAGGTLLPVRAAPVSSAAIITPGTPVTAGRKVFLACTAAGNIRLKLGDGTSVLDVPVNVGPSMIDELAVVDVVAGSTTATCVTSVLN